MRDRRRQLGVLLVLAASVGLAGCASPSTADAAAGCVPLMDVSPRTAHPGDVVTLSTSDRCDVPVPDGGWLVEAGPPVSDGPEARVRTSDPLDGRWSVEVRVPEDFPVGEAYIGISNWDFRTCPDDASCASPATNFTLVR